MKEQTERISTIMTTAMAETMGPLMESIFKGKGNDGTEGHSDSAATSLTATDNMNTAQAMIEHRRTIMERQMEIIKNINILKHQITDLQSSFDESRESNDRIQKNSKRLKIMEKMVDQAYDDLDRLQDEEEG